MVVINLTLTHAGDILYIRLTNACERPNFAPVGIELTLGLAHGSEEPYNSNFFMVAMNLSLTLIYGNKEPYVRTYSCLWETLHRDRHMMARNVTKTYSWWWETLRWNLLMFVTNLTLRLTHADEKSFAIKKYDPIKIIWNQLIYIINTSSSFVVSIIFL